MVVAYGVLLGVVAQLTAPLGIVGGLLLWLVMMACLSSWLSLVEQVIRSGRVRLGDVPSSFAAYLGELLAVGFLTSLLGLVASVVLAPFRFLAIVFGLAVLVFFNAVPELIYLGRRGGGKGPHRGSRSSVHARLVIAASPRSCTRARDLRRSPRWGPFPPRTACATRRRPPVCFLPRRASRERGRRSADSAAAAR